MIEASGLTKEFDGIRAVDQIDAIIREQSVFGLIGTNGAGKSTFLRLACGILKPDQGTITIDGQNVFENPEVKERIFYISDEAYFFSQATPEDMMSFYKKLYRRFDTDRFNRLMDSFGLDKRRKINTFSKGMKKQVSVICGICSGTDYLLCDETFDGLDPVMRQAVKSLFAEDMEDRGLTPVVASHNLRELEDICDHVGLLHRGGILLSKDLEDLKLNLHKLQCVFQDGITPENIEGLDIMSSEQRGRLWTITVRGTREAIEERIRQSEPVFFECIPLTLEEIFISETEVAGYDIRKLIL